MLSNLSFHVYGLYYVLCRQLDIGLNFLLLWTCSFCRGARKERCKERRTEAREEETQKARTIQTEAQHATCINLHELPSKLHGAVLARPVENQCGEYDLLRHDLSLLATVE